MGGQFINVGGHHVSKETRHLYLGATPMEGGAPVPPPKPGSKGAGGAGGAGSVGGAGEGGLAGVDKGIKGEATWSSSKGWYILFPLKNCWYKLFFSKQAIPSKILIRLEMFQVVSLYSWLLFIYFSLIYLFCRCSIKASFSNSPTWAVDLCSSSRVNMSASAAFLSNALSGAVDSHVLVLILFLFFFVFFAIVLYEK